MYGKNRPVGLIIFYIPTPGDDFFFFTTLLDFSNQGIIKGEDADGLGQTLKDC